MIKKTPQKRILDVCCGGRMFWFDKSNIDVLYVDNRIMQKQVIWSSKTEERTFEVHPDKVMDFRNLDLPGRSFSLVVFDPPHLAKRNGKTGWMQKKYGSLHPKSWRDDISKGFSECFRVLKRNGVLVFKWSEAEITLGEILKLTPNKPLFGHKTGKNTHWVVFMK